MRRIPDPLVLASRGSRLALRQAEIVSELLRGAHPEVRVTVMVVTTTGDRDQRSFAAIGAKGVFTSEVERAVVEGAADVAVHSAKDLTADLAPGCSIMSVPARAAVHDVVIGGDGTTGDERLSSLAPGSRVGTSSARRRALLAGTRPDLEVTELRGNLDTRLGKVARGDVDATILAAAGLERLGVDGAQDGRLDPTWWVPAPGQGALALEALESRTELRELLGGLGDVRAEAEVACERAYAARMQGGCSVPLGCIARAGADGLVVSGFLSSPDGADALRDRISGPVSDAVALGTELAEAMLSCGGSEILEDVRIRPVPEVPAP